MSEPCSMEDFLHANLVMNNVLECVLECHPLTLYLGVTYMSIGECVKQMARYHNAHAIALVARDHLQD